jgi:glycerol-3-phosphate dehydrogenase
MAERTVDLALRQLEAEEKRPYVLSRSSGRKLSGGRIHSLKAFIAEIGETTLTKEQLSGLFHRYGSNALSIIGTTDMAHADRTLAILLAELRYCLEQEMVTELSDFLIRRTGRLYFEKAVADRYSETLNDLLAQELGLSDEAREASLQTYLHESADVLNFVS